MQILIFRLGAATELLLVCAHSSAIPFAQSLPIGGAQSTQMGIVFGLTFVAAEVSAMIEGA